MSELPHVQPKLEQIKSEIKQLKSTLSLQFHSVDEVKQQIKQIQETQNQLRILQVQVKGKHIEQETRYSQLPEQIDDWISKCDQLLELARDYLKDPEAVKKRIKEGKARQMIFFIICLFVVLTAIVIISKIFQ